MSKPIYIHDRHSDDLMATGKPFTGKKKTLLMLLILSVMLHFFVVLNFGGYRLLVDQILTDNPTVEMPAIMQMRQLNEEYTVNLEKTPKSHTVIREVPVTLAIQTDEVQDHEKGPSVEGP
ncbi:MAG: hypothetical protein ACPGKS_07900 [Coraliomargarita sp.]